MLSRAGRLFGIVLVAVGLMSLVRVPAGANGGGCLVWDTLPDGSVVCTLWAADPGQPAPPQPGPPGDPGDPGDPPPDGGEPAPPPPPDPCTTVLLVPPPPAGDPRWNGADPATNDMFRRFCGNFADDQSNPRIEFIVVPKGQQPAPPPVDPEVLAQQAIASMTFTPPPIALAPPPESEGAIVGVPVWLWFEAGPTTSGPQSVSLSAGAVTVTVTAEAQRTDWALGDGGAVTCLGAGTPYDPSYEGGPSPDCGHVYEVRSTRGDPEARYVITATTHWVITWTSNVGASGTQTLDLTSESSLRVTEINVLNVPDPGGG